MEVIALRGETLPEETVVPDLSGVVEKTAGAGLDDLLEGEVLVVRVLDEVVRVVDVGLVVLTVVVVKRFRRHVRRQRVT